MSKCADCWDELTESERAIAEKCEGCGLPLHRECGIRWEPSNLALLSDSLRCEPCHYVATTPRAIRDETEHAPLTEWMAPPQRKGEA